MPKNHTKSSDDPRIGGALNDLLTLNRRSRGEVVDVSCETIAWMLCFVGIWHRDVDTGRCRGPPAAGRERLDVIGHRSWSWRSVSNIAILSMRPSFAKASKGILPRATMADLSCEARQREAGWRMGWDSNPREGLTSAGFQDRCLKPLGHPSVCSRGALIGVAPGRPVNSVCSKTVCRRGAGRLQAARRGAGRGRESSKRLANSARFDNYLRQSRPARVRRPGM